MKITLNGANMTTRAAAHAEIARALDFPDWYGANLDALWDMISHMDAEITLVNAAQMCNVLGDYAESLLDTFREAASLGRGFHFHEED